MCIFCDNISKRNDKWVNWYIIKDEFPVSLGHTLIIPKRHVQIIDELTPFEWEELQEIIFTVKRNLKYTTECDGFNIGINEGTAAGQSIMHLHIHIIPRYEGDVEQPRGGVRGVIPNKQNY